MNPIYELRHEKLEQSLHLDLRRVICVGACEYDTFSKLAVLQFKIVVDGADTLLIRAKNPAGPESDVAIQQVRLDLIAAWKAFAAGRIHFPINESTR